MASRRQVFEPQAFGRARDRALILALLGFLLLLPPVAMVFEIPASVGGIPVTVAYLFIVWALLIAGAAALSRQLRVAVDDAGDLGQGRDPQSTQEQNAR